MWITLIDRRIGKFTYLGHILGFPGGSEDKVSAYNVGDPGLIPGSGRSPGEGNGNPLQYSCLENPMDGGAWWATVHRVAKGRTWLSNFTFISLSELLFNLCNISLNFMWIILTDRRVGEFTYLGHSFETDISFCFKVKSMIKWSNFVNLDADIKVIFFLVFDSVTGKFWSMLGTTHVHESTFQLWILWSKNRSSISDENLASKLRYTVRVKHSGFWRQNRIFCNISH